MTSPAQRIALAYFEAWTSHDLDRAMTYVAEDVVCDAPAGRLEGAEAYRGFMGPFVRTLRNASLIASFGDDRTAVVVYDTETALVASAPAAECVTVEDGRITYSRFIFDRVPFAAARAAAG
jgi:ketosteroid isomerase-like protein